MQLKQVIKLLTNQMFLNRFNNKRIENIPKGTKKSQGSTSHQEQYSFTIGIFHFVMKSVYMFYGIILSAFLATGELPL